MKIDNPLTSLVKEVLHYEKPLSKNQLVLMRKLKVEDLEKYVRMAETAWEFVCEHAEGGTPISFIISLEEFMWPEFTVRCGERYYIIGLHMDSPGFRGLRNRLGKDYIYQEDIRPAVQAWLSKNYADAVLPMVEEPKMRSVQETDVFVVDDGSVWSVDSGLLVTVGLEVKRDPCVFTYKRGRYGSSDLEVETTEPDCEVLVTEFEDSCVLAIEYCETEDLNVEWLLKLEKFYRDGRSNLPDEVFDHIMAVKKVSEESLQEMADSAFGKKKDVGLNSLGVDSGRAGVSPVYPAEEKILSQDKVRDIEELDRIANGWGGKSVISWKLDGVAVRLHYHGDKFVRAETKGKARDVTDLMRNVPMIPFEIKHGRPFVEPMFKEDWFVTGELVAVGSRRSVAAGYLLRKDFDSRETKKIAEGLYFVVYDSNIHKFASVDYRVSPLSLYSQMIELLLEAEFKCVQLFDYRYNCIKDLMETVPSWCDVDGMVVRVNDITKYASLGETAHHPKGSVAFKFEDTWHKVKVKRIYGRIGCNKVIKLICEFKPIVIDGKTVSSATFQPRDDGDWKLVYDWTIKTKDRCSNYEVLMRGENGDYVSLTKCVNVDEVEVCLRGKVIPQWRFIKYGE